MLRTIVYFCSFNLAVLSLCSCSNGDKAATFVGNENKIALKYARNILITKCNNYYKAEIKNPWDTTKLLNTYVLVPKGKHAPSNVNGVVIHIPLHKAVVFTAVHSSLILQLNALSSISGVCDLEYIKQPDIRKSVKEGHIADLGNSMEPDVEKIISLSPDAILLSPFENSGGYGRVGNLGVPIIECADYMETSPLSRAEWIKFYGLLFGKADVADSIFSAVSYHYNTLKNAAIKAKEHPSVFCGTMEGAVWYIPGGRSTTGILYHDAGANYAFADNQKSGSVPLPFETVYERAAKTSIWFVNYFQKDSSLTYRQLLSQNSRYSQFAAFRNHNVYACNTGRTSYYEDYPFHPDMLLQNLIEILHPELAKTRFYSYYCKLLN